jgi:hypothetical protein
MNMRLTVPFILFALLLTACGASTPQSVEEDASPTPTSIPKTVTATENPTEEPVPTRDFDNNPPAGAEREFITDFSKLAT